jgi:hypothetical protein
LLPSPLWDIYEQVPFIQDGTPPHVALLSVHDLSTIFLLGGLGVEDQNSGLREVPMLLHAISVCGGGPNRNSAEQNRQHFMNGEKTLRDSLPLFDLIS